MTTASASAREDFDVATHPHGGKVPRNLNDHLAAYLPISSDRFALEAGVDRQLDSCPTCTSSCSHHAASSALRDSFNRCQSGAVATVGNMSGGLPAPR
ncbi:hypothetical protein [Streptomyces lydicus]|uniref:hypothetical protein n=1 Tax=Streptomyces lydicus TaxID=47763 RepID=UPI003440CA71